MSGWKATLTTVHDAAGEALERAVVTILPGARESYTGEDMLEVTVHGSPFLVEAVIESVRRCRGAARRAPANSLGEPWRTARWTLFRPRRSAT